MWTNLDTCNLSKDRRGAGATGPELTYQVRCCSPFIRAVISSLHLCCCWGCLARLLRHQDKELDVESSKHEGVHLVLYLLVTKAVAIAVLQTHSKHEDVHLVLYLLVT